MKAAAVVGLLVLTGCAASPAPVQQTVEQVDHVGAHPVMASRVMHHASRASIRPAVVPKVVTAPVRRPTPKPKPTAPPVGFSGWAHAHGTWRVFNCESHWNPTDVSASGRYRGLIQADATFWKSWHGLQFAPRPDLATATEQLQVAYWAWRKRGWSPWPTCGRLA